MGFFWRREDVGEEIFKEFENAFNQPLYAAE